MRNISLSCFSLLLGLTAPASAQTTSGSPANADVPNVYTNQTNLVPPGSAYKAVGKVTSDNSDVPFTIEVLSLKVVGNQSVLSLAITNGGSGKLDPSGQFNSSITDLANPTKISGVYLVDPASRQKFEVARPTETQALCSKIEPVLGPGERRVLEARFAAIPGGVKTVYVYFPHASPIADVAVNK